MNRMSNEELAYLEYLLQRLLVDPRLNFGENLRVQAIRELVGDLPHHSAR